jgi:cysteinyl-tRNA synthetase
MNRAAFGEQIDIHGGGRDLIFPHHENEIAQTEALTGKEFSKYWVHNGLIKVNGQKMSKSLGNSLLLEDLLKKYTNEAVKFGLLQTNYRADINITDDLFPEAEKHLYEFYTVFDKVEKAFPNAGGDNKAIDDEFNDCMDDDFNTALAISNLYGYFKTINAKLAAGDKTAAADCAQIRKTYSLLGIFRKKTADYLAEYAAKNAEEIPAAVTAIAEERFQARLQKDWAKSDELRAKLTDLGYAVKDSKEGYTLSKIK